MCRSASAQILLQLGMLKQICIVQPSRVRKVLHPCVPRIHVFVDTLQNPNAAIYTLRALVRDNKAKHATKLQHRCERCASRWDWVVRLWLLSGAIPIGPIERCWVDEKSDLWNQRCGELTFHLSLSYFYTQSVLQRRFTNNNLTRVKDALVVF